MSLDRRTLLKALPAWASAGSAWAVHTPESASPTAVRMPGPPFPIGQHPFFQGELASLALRKAGWPEGLQILSTQTWPRQVRELRDGHADVAPLPALNPALYADFALRRVDFPLRRGLLGVRQLVVRADRVAEFKALPHLAALQQRHRLGYGLEWGDLPLMQQLGFQVVTARSTELLYEGLRQGSIDFLSRGINEVSSEMLRLADPKVRLAVVPGVLLFYPLDDCFFVSPHRPELHEALSRGLALAFRDGSYAALFRQHFGEALSGVREARVWRLNGYPLPPGLPLTDYDVLNRWVPRGVARSRGAVQGSQST